jgi:hypothetical protein
MLNAEQRQLLSRALEDVGAAPGGLHTPLSEVTPFGSEAPPAPRRDPIGPWELQFLTARLVAACFCTIAALSGMRYSEIVEIRPGGIEPLDDGIGVIRWRLRSKLVKGQRHGGRPESWHVILPVVDAIEILERLHTNGPDDPLLSHDLCRTHARPPDKPIRRLRFPTLLRDLIAWQNNSGARAGLQPIPEVDGRPWPLAPRQFRRTLAREIEFRPHGTIASKIQLKQSTPRSPRATGDPPANPPSGSSRSSAANNAPPASSASVSDSRNGSKVSRSPAAPSTASSRSSSWSPASSTASRARSTSASNACESCCANAPTPCTSGSSTTATSPIHPNPAL